MVIGSLVVSAAFEYVIPVIVGVQRCNAMTLNPVTLIYNTHPSTPLLIYDANNSPYNRATIREDAVMWQK